MNGKAALVFPGRSEKKELFIMEKWFWAWQRLKYNESKDETPQENTDAAFLGAVISAMYPKHLPKGDGKFSRVSSYLGDVRVELEWCRRNWKSENDQLDAFFGGVDAAITAMTMVAEMIKKGR